MRLSRCDVKDHINFRKTDRCYLPQAEVARLTSGQPATTLRISRCARGLVTQGSEILANVVH
jgi:hypothetical protein